MKIVSSSYIFITIFFIMNLSGCGNKNNNPVIQPDPQAVARTKLTAGTWSLINATRDNVVVNSDYEGFNITFTSLGYSDEYGGTAFSSIGTWLFSGESADTLIMDGKQTMVISFSNDDQRLRMTFTIPETDYSLGRTDRLQGDYVFDVAR